MSVWPSVKEVPPSVKLQLALAFIEAAKGIGLFAELATVLPPPPY